MLRSWAGMEGLVTENPAPRRPVLAALRAAYPGLLLALTIAIAATWLAQHYDAPVMLFALLFGITFHFLHEDGRCREGVDVASRLVLRWGVALLGARVTYEQIAGLGWAPIGIVAVGVFSTLAIGLLLGQVLGLGRGFGLLSGGSVGICGASAALAIAAVLPKTRETERDTILVVVVVTAMSTLAMVLYPIFVTWLALGDQRGGLFLGGTIHDVAQVVGAGYTISTATGDVATYVKLLRVALLLPVVFAIGLLIARNRGEAARTSPPLPLFLLAFAALALLNSLHLLPAVATAAAGEVSRWCLVVAIAALGVKTSFKSIIRAGWRPVAAIVLETVWIAGVVLIGIQWLT